MAGSVAAPRSDRVLLHVSEDPTITRFVPHVPRIATEAVEPLRVRPLGDLLAAHVEAGIELRLVPSLWPLHDLAVSDRWDFSIVRMANARPRSPD